MTLLWLATRTVIVWISLSTCNRCVATAADEDLKQAIFSQYVVLLMTIFRTIGPLWDGNTPDWSCSNNMKSPYVKWSGHDAETKKKNNKKNNVSHWDPKWYHSIRGDSDGFRLLMACEVIAVTHIGNPCLMFRLTIIFLKPNRPKNV